MPTRLSNNLIAVLTSACLMTACSTHTDLDSVLSEQFVHKYGFQVDKDEWEERAEEGQVVTLLKNGVTITRTYENGVLHGNTTHTFPNSKTVEKLLVYDQGVLFKECIHDLNGIPIQEELFEVDDRKIITLWDEKGVPLSVEEYEGERLIEGSYYTAEHLLEGEVSGGIGDRIRRDRKGLLLSHDRIENGVIASKTTYHPNGQIHTISHYHDHQLHGEQLKYSSQGRPLMILQWNHGVLDGTKQVFRSGYKVAEIPYVHGQKHGVELHYDDLGNLTAEIQWRNDKKHGSRRLYSEEGVDVEWFHKDQLVTAEKFEALDMREQLIAEFNGETLQN